MKLESAIEEWKQDSIIDPTRLSDEIVKTPMLHAKYLEEYILHRAKAASFNKAIAKMKYLKRRYYRGEMDKQELAHHGWDAFQGLKPSGSELNQLFDMDADLVELAEKLEYHETGIKMIEYVLKQIQGRDYTLKTLYEYQRYTNG
jgi:hypothetical protein